MKAPIAALSLALVVAACGTGSANSGTTGPTTAAPAPTTTVKAATPDADDPMSRAAGSLVDAFDLAQSGLGLDEIAARLPVLLFDESGVLVQVTLDGLDADTVTDLEAAGLTDARAFPEYLTVTGSIAPDAIDQLVSIPGVDLVTPQYGATTNQAP